MSKVVRLNEQELVKLVKKILKEDTGRFTTTAVVEDDMLMKFTVNAFNVGASGVYMMMTDYQNKKCYVICKRGSDSFMGPIYDRASKKIAFTDSSFEDIDLKNYQQIAKQNGIPIYDSTTNVK
jgi:hypothetical protein